jgi:cytoskeletal protein RodZ
MMTELGKFLKDTRDKKGISLDELQAITKVQKRYLTAIEAGNYDILPGKFYARAFIKTYAEAIGQDPTMIFEKFKEDLPFTAEESAREGLTRTKNKNKKNASASKWIDYLPKVLIILLFIGLTASFWMFLQMNSSSNGKQRDEKPSHVEIEGGDISDNDELDHVNNEPDQEQNDTVDIKNPPEDTEDEPVIVGKVLSVKESKNESTTYYEIQNGVTLKIKLTFTDRCYVAIRNGKKHSFHDKIFNQEEIIEQDYSAEEKIIIRLGAAKKAKLFINGEEFTFPTKKDIQNVIITKSQE